MKHIFFLTLFSICVLSTQAQSEIDLIKSTLLDYIEGTANGEPDRLRTAFHPDFNLYYVANDSLQAWSGANYISRITPGEKNNRIGRIVSIDYENDAASAKVEIDMPHRKKTYTDYFLLLKIKGQWQIIHKSFTSEPYPE